jgi:hypothetical protein
VLQKGPAQAQTGQYRGRAPLVHLSAEVGDFSDTMAIVEALDVVVTIDTSVAHLAGAMGRPVWIMLPHVAEWRWLQARADSPWYPSARLFRQPAPGDWGAVAGAVARALAERVATPRSHAERTSTPRSRIAAHNDGQVPPATQDRRMALENALEIT